MSRLPAQVGALREQHFGPPVRHLVMRLRPVRARIAIAAVATAAACAALVGVAHVLPTSAITSGAGTIAAEGTRGGSDAPTPSANPTSGPTSPPTPTDRHGKRYTSTAAADQLSGATSVAEAQRILQSFVSQYGVTIEITKITPSSYAQEFDHFQLIAVGNLTALKHYGAVFIDEWAKYPTDWVHASGLASIALVTHLAAGIDPAAGALTPVAATPDPVGHTMYYDVGYLQDGGARYVRHVIHHEFDHLIEYQRYGEFIRADPRWESYNPRGFRYGHGGASCYRPTSTCLTGEHPIPGFVSGYAASDVAEDKAEIYAELMVGSEYHSLLDWMKHDAALAHKVSAYQTMIASQSPEMDVSYFSAVNP